MKISKSSKRLISIVTPCFNEELSVQECFERTKLVIENNLPGWDYEHIFCDNASTDGTLDILREIARQNPAVKVIANSRNFGPFNSMFNGMLATKGDVVVPFLPADCQDPPEVIADFVSEWEKGSLIVYGERATREESRTLRSIRRTYYKLVNRMANISIPLNVGEFTLIDRKVIDSLREVEDYYPYLRGLIANTGYRSTKIQYTWKSRKKGISKNNAYALIDQGLNGLISFSNVPMRLVMFAGFSIASISILYALITFITAIVNPQPNVQPGIQTLIIGLFFFSGVTLFSLGFMGEYVSAIHSQVRKRPLVIEHERINFK